MNEPAADLNPPAWAFGPATAADRCCEFIRETMAAAGRERLVLGLSGGIDSAVAAGLAARAVGAEHGLRVLLPYASRSDASRVDAEAVATHLGLSTETITITSMADAYLTTTRDADPVRRGNVMARSRMIILYDLSARDGSLVLGTGNRTEALLGYTTLYGDNACALNPVGQLYKTEIRLLAAWLDLPAAVLTKAPSADLWEGQTDEGELGVTYAVADEILHALIDDGRSESRVAALGHDPGVVTMLAERVAAMAYKRRGVPVAVFPGRRDPDPAMPTPVDGGFH